MTSVLSIVWQTKFEVIASWLFSNTLAAERLAVSFQAVCSSKYQDKAQSALYVYSCQFSCGFFISLSLYPAATHSYCHICPLACGIECLASPEAAVNASFLLCWLGMHLASSVSTRSLFFFHRHQALK